MYMPNVHYGNYKLYTMELTPDKVYMWSIYTHTIRWIYLNIRNRSFTCTF